MNLLLAHLSGTLTGHDWQAGAALIVVAVAVAGLVWRAWARQRAGQQGCGNEGCAAVSSEVRKLKARVRRRAGDSQ